ncbi:LA_2272 family surface repeat-containing protein [Thalassomonas sp. M1454]|uniref:LA_2272 family surface repeat-containing protein n=1 Tax=Thalassomonas sp. M1454 TaxID=2594477 RepID=UPI00117EE874|nr:hypothetical protein [Thalassomonas sp. M1454]TRX57046.1 hypothetical protein FNN08_05975 [Thalassomonas sp. M1454]
MKKLVSTIALLGALSTPVMAAEFIQLSVPNNNFPPGDVEGVRFSLLYGQTNSVKGVDISILGLAESNNFTGLGLDFLGAQRVKNHFTGASLSWANWHDNTGVGGVIGAVNYTENNFTGLQLGFANYAGTLNGVQFGFVNATQRINKGVQIGLINYDASGTFVSKDFPVFPIINGRF